MLDSSYIAHMQGSSTVTPIFSSIFVFFPPCSSLPPSHDHAPYLQAQSPIPSPSIPHFSLNTSASTDHYPKPSNIRRGQPRCQALARNPHTANRVPRPPAFASKSTFPPPPHLPPPPHAPQAACSSAVLAPWYLRSLRTAVSAAAARGSKSDSDLGLDARCAASGGGWGRLAAIGQRCGSARARREGRKWNEEKETKKEKQMRGTKGHVPRSPSNAHTPAAAAPSPSSPCPTPRFLHRRH